MMDDEQVDGFDGFAGEFEVPEEDVDEVIREFAMADTEIDVLDLGDADV